MNDDAVLLYPRGFLLGEPSISPPSGYVPGPLLEGLWLHPTVEYDESESNGRFVIVVGSCATTMPNDQAQNAPSRLLLTALLLGDEQFFSALSELTGRFAVIYGSASAPHVVSDATGMRAVFYAETGLPVASHAHLVDVTSGGSGTREHRVFAFGHPGNRTPYPTTKLLTPNTSLDVRTGQVHRFWPTSPIPVRQFDEVARQAIEQALAGLSALARNRPVRVALTAGLDSRLMVALARYADIDFETYTYDHTRVGIDRAVAQEVSKMIGVRHSVIPSARPNRELSRLLATANYQPHHVSVVSGLMEYFPDESSLAVTGNLLEIGRRFFAPMVRAGVVEPRTPETLADLHRLKMRWKVRQTISEQGEAKWMSAATEDFAEFAEDTDFFSAAELVDPFDLFYWEHRMGAWHGPVMNERDFYAEACIPLNVRSIFEAMLGVEPDRREDGSVFVRMVELLFPELLNIPVNPSRWPV